MYAILHWCRGFFFFGFFFVIWLPSPEKRDFFFFFLWFWFHYNLSCTIRKSTTTTQISWSLPNIIIKTAVLCVMVTLPICNEEIQQVLFFFIANQFFFFPQSHIFSLCHMEEWYPWMGSLLRKWEHNFQYQSTTVHFGVYTTHFTHILWTYGKHLKPRVKSRSSTVQW